MPDAVREASAHLLTTPSLVQLLAAKRGHSAKAEVGRLLGELTSDRAAKKEDPAPSERPRLSGELAEEEEGMAEEPEREPSPCEQQLQQQQPQVQDPYEFLEE